MNRRLKSGLNYRMLLRVTGGLLRLEGAFMCIPVFVALFYGEADWSIFAVCAAVTAALGFGLSRYARPETTHFGRRESYLLTGSVWVIFSLLGMLPFIFGSPRLDVSQAFFEAMSGFTTTGATSRPSDAPILSHAILIWMALMQWLGGMGIILFTLAVIPGLNSSGGMQMFNAEVPGITHDKIMPRISQTAMSLWAIYAFLTLLMALLLWLGPMNLFDAVCHAFGTLSTGGFATPSGLATAFGSDYVIIVTTVFMFLGGVNFTLIFNVVLGRWHKVRVNDILRVFCMAIVVFTALFILSNWLSGNASSWRDLTIGPLFQVVSAITSTGYIWPGFAGWGQFVLALTFVMMLSGGCAGSTSGGAKIDRLLYLHRRVSNEINRCIHPNAVLSVRINGQVQNPDLVNKVVSFLALYLMIIGVGGLLLAALGLPSVDSFFSAFACISNTGFGASVTGYGDDFAQLPDAAYWVLAAIMLIGRLEIFTILVLFSKTFWRR